MSQGVGHWYAVRWVRKDQGKEGNLLSYRKFIPWSSFQQVMDNVARGHSFQDSGTDSSSALVVGGAPGLRLHLEPPRAVSHWHKAEELPW